MSKLPGQAAAFVVSLLGMSIAGVSDAMANGIGGCVLSPENPTAVLGLLGGAAAAYPWLRGQITARLRKTGRPESDERSGEGDGA